MDVVDATRRAAVVDLLAAARRARGMSQRCLSVRLGLAHNSVGRWERGDAAPLAEVAVRWLTFLNLPVPADVDELFPPGRPQCGTRPGYQRHRRRGERCADCWAGYAAYMREWRKGRVA
jgi:transcriptional regulator with XRE-family HTH domain